MKINALFLVFCIFALTNCGRKTLNKFKSTTQQCSFNANEFLLKPGWNCQDPGWTLNQGSGKIGFQAKGKDWYIGGYNPSGQMVYIIMFAEGNNSSTKILNGSSFGTISGCEAKMPIDSQYVYDYVVTIDGPTGQVKIDKDQGVYFPNFNHANYQPTYTFQTIFHCTPGQALLQQAVKYRFSCLCSPPSDPVVTFYHYRKAEVTPGQPNWKSKV
jgi:hypothetical protein